MEISKTYSLPFKRKLEGKTDYRKRIKLLSSGQYRLVVRVGLRSAQVSLIRYSSGGDKVDVSVNSSSLDKFGWKGDKGNIPSAYLTGYLAGLKAKEKKINYAILDVGMRGSVKSSRIYAAMSGAIDSGLKVPQDGNNLPSKERINGTHVAQYAHLIKTSNGKYEKQFSGYLKRGINPEDIAQHFAEVKSRIAGS